MNEIPKPVTIPDLNLQLLWIAPGVFTMGSPATEAERNPDETSHRVTLSRGYWLGKTEVTQGQWEAVMGNNPSYFKQAGRIAPVENISWEDAMEFCRQLTSRAGTAGPLPEGYEYTLPTEAQWESACRAGTEGANAGNLGAMGWYDMNSGATTYPVGQKQANAWVLHHMHGNVFEWCLDWYDHRSYLTGAATNPTGATSGSLRVLRGGGWSCPRTLCRSAFRNGFEPGDRERYLGFRLAQSSDL